MTTHVSWEDLKRYECCCDEGPHEASPETFQSQVFYRASDVDALLLVHQQPIRALIEKMKHAVHPRLTARDTVYVHQVDHWIAELEALLPEAPHV